MVVETLTDRKVVKQSNILNTAKYTLSALSTDILHLFLAQIYKEDKDFKEFNISIKEIENKLEKRINRKYIETVCKELTTNSIRLKEEDNTVVFVNWASVAKYNLKKNFLVLKISEELKNHLLELKSLFVQTSYKEISKLKTFYSKRLYMLFLQYKTSGFYTILIEDLKFILDIEENHSYDNYFDFKKRVLTPSIKQINEKTSLNISLKEIKQGRKTIRLEFSIKKDEEQKLEKPIHKSGVIAAEEWLRKKTKLVA